MNDAMDIEVTRIFIEDLNKFNQNRFSVITEWFCAFTKFFARGISITLDFIKNQLVTLIVVVCIVFVVLILVFRTQITEYVKFYVPEETVNYNSKGKFAKEY